MLSSADVTLKKVSQMSQKNRLIAKNVNDVSCSMDVTLCCLGLNFVHGLCIWEFTSSCSAAKHLTNCWFSYMQFLQTVMGFIFCIDFCLKPGSLITQFLFTNHLFWHKSCPLFDESIPQSRHKKIARPNKKVSMLLFWFFLLFFELTYF